jgi:hypothetical protein
MGDAVVVSTARTAIGTAFEASLVVIGRDGAGGGMSTAVVIDVPKA